MGLSPLTGDLATGKDLVQQEPFTCLSWNILLGWHSLAHRWPPGPLLRKGRSHGPPAAPGSVVAESKEKSDLFLSASQGYASNIKEKGVQLIQKADLSHFTDAKTEFLPT